jgi:dethiobiotin synthetase
LRHVSRETFHVKQRLTLVGTGTSVGKTHVGQAILSHAQAIGKSAVGLKPIESGIEEGGVSDASKLRELSSTRVVAAPYQLREPISPHLAARREGVSIDLGVVAEWVDRHDHELTVVETAGGLLSPLSATTTNLDLAEAVGGRIVVVSIDRLGVLHDVAAVLLALRSRGLQASGIALNAADSSDASTGTNAAELEALHGVSVVAFPRAEPGDRQSVVAAKTLLARLV